MTLEEAMAKVSKLLKLAEHQNSNPNEAATAAAMAQEILTRYEIDKSMLNTDQGGELGGEKEEEIIDFTRAGAPLDVLGERIVTWKGYLAGSIAKANQSRIYFHRNLIGIVGRPSDVEKVRYIYDMLVREVDRLTVRAGNGMGKTWRNNFRIGVVDTIAKKLDETKNKVASQMRNERANNPFALVRVNQAIAKLEQKGKSVEKFLEEKVPGLKPRLAPFRGDKDARQQGQEAGKEINIGSARGALPSGAPKLRS